MIKKEPNQINQIAIDSNVFRSKDFLNFLFTNKNKIKLNILPIVQIEVGYYFMNKGKDWESFLGYLSNYNASIRDWENLDIRKILESAITNKNNLPFKHHFRDFLIGIHCENLSLDLVTYNKKHFQWMKKVKIFTPDEFVLQLQNTL